MKLEELIDRLADVMVNQRYPEELEFGGTPEEDHAIRSKPNGDREILVMDSSGSCMQTFTIDNIGLTTKGRIFIEVDAENDPDWDESESTDLELELGNQKYRKRELQKEIDSGKVKFIDGKKYVLSDETDDK